MMSRSVIKVEANHEREAAARAVVETAKDVTRSQAVPIALERRVGRATPRLRLQPHARDAAGRRGAHGTALLRMHGRSGLELLRGAGVTRAASRTRLVAWVVFAVAAVVVATRLPVADLAVHLVNWIRDAGTTGILVFALVYVIATVAMLPGSLLTLGAGFVYGPLFGTLLVSPVSVVAATCAFLLGRSIARDWVARRVAAAPRFGAIDHAVEREGFKIVALLRLSPLVPFNLLNYALALTRVRLRDYVLASWLGMLPVTLLYVYLGSLLTNASEVASGAPRSSSPATRVLYWGGLAATVAVAWLVTRTARRALDRSLDEPVSGGTAARSRQAQP